MPSFIPLWKKKPPERITLSLSDMCAESWQIKSKRKAMFDAMLKDASDG